MAHKKAHILSLIYCLFIAQSALTGCSGNARLITKKSEPAFLPSGTIVLSRQIPTAERNTVLAASTVPSDSIQYAPLIGYFPPSDAFLPAENETWLEIDTASSKVLVYRGKTVVKSITAQGKITMKPGNYAIQHKQKRPLWYAGDDYFVKRGLPIPKAGERIRYRKGALGNFVIYPSTDFPIHSAPVWSEEVGGLKVSRADLSAIYYMVPLGTPVVVK